MKSIRQSAVGNRQYSIVSFLIYGLLILTLVFILSASAQAAFDNTDDFEDGGTTNWTGGKAGAPVNISSGGPDGSDDNYLQVVSANFHLGTYNGTQWTGNYNLANMDAIEMDMKKIAGSANLQMRILVFGPGGAFASRDRTPVVPTNGWAHYRFGLTTGDMVYVSGAGADGGLSNTLNGVTKLLIRNDYATPTPIGAHPPHITATLGIDNIRPVRAGDANWPQISLVDSITVTNRPVFVTNANDGSNRLFVVQQPGVIRIIKDGVVVPTPFLDIDARVTGGTSGGDERGLLGLAFPPGSGMKDYFYVYYYASSPDKMVLSRFWINTNNADLADSTSEQIILEIPQPQANHNGGTIAFGNDGYLYVSMGDGGGGNDDDAGHDATVGNGQATNTLLGKILRLDVETPPLTNDYIIPAGNPLTNDPGARAEIWAYGLRNPYRMSFDRKTYDLYIGDVGQGAWEEVDFQDASSTGAVNYGWRRYEATTCTGIQGDPCGTNGLTDPVWEYDHSNGRQAVVGGYVHRGAPPWSFLHGTYIYADYSSGEIWGLKKIGTNWQNILLRSSGIAIAGFGEDEPGDVYVCAIFANQLHRIEETLADSDGDGMPDAYEVHYGFYVNDMSDGAADADQDGMSNVDELVAGTDPTNQLSNLKVTTVDTVSTNQVILTWSSVSQRWYSVSQSTNLFDSFLPVASNLPGTPPVNVYTGSLGSSAVRFYQVGVQP